MRYLFLDNFRGFSNTLLSLRDVNFFVGENSTGKTSMLSLICLLNSADFWFTQDFNTNEVRFGNYSDIVSVASSDRSSFRIGLADSADEEKPQRPYVVRPFLSTFAELEGAPIASKATFLAQKRQVKVSFSGKTAKYWDEGPCENPRDPESALKLFLRWATGHQQESGRGYRTIRTRGGPKDSFAMVSWQLDEMLRKRGHGGGLGRGAFLGPAFGDMAWLAPIRTRPLRTYDSYSLDFSPEGVHTPYLIKKYLARRTPEQRLRADRFVSFIEKFGRESGLFRSISVRDYEPRTTTSPFELDIVLSDEALSVNNVGYGVSQSLPVIVELFARPRDTWFAIQQPEIHLHPRAQAALGDVMFELALAENKKFLVETHSDFIIDGFRLNYRKKESHKLDSQVIFFKRNATGNVAHEMRLTARGELPADQPPEWRGFFLKHDSQLLGL